MNPSRPAFICASCARSLRQATNTPPSSARQFSRSAPSAINDSVPDDKSILPRWMKTPERLRQPIHLRPRTEQAVSWRVNSDPEKLNAAYDSFLGRVAGNRLRGRDLLDEQTKWLATTHKSHEHGAQGFNSRLAYLGKRILDLQTSLALLSAPSPTSPNFPPSEVYHHPALSNLENISPHNKSSTLHKSRLAALATQHGLDQVVRWKPKNAENLKQSGVEAVLAQTVFAIIGAVALQRGGEVAAKTARERVLAPLGLR